MIDRPTTTQVAAAILATIRAGTFLGNQINASLADGSEVTSATVVVTSPALGFELLEEGWIEGASEWPMQLYSSNGKEAAVGMELAFMDAVIAALQASPTLGGVVTGSYLMPSDSASGQAAKVNEPPTRFRRELRLHVDH